MITTWMANRFHELTTRTALELPSTRVIVAAAYQQGAKQSQMDTRPNQENNACDTTPSEEHCIRGTCLTNA